MTRDRPPDRFFADDRAVSIAVTHVLAIGITTLLITALLVGAGGVLSQQRDQAARQELDTIGNRLAAQIAKADSLVDDGGSTEVVQFVVDQPAKVSGGSYSVNLRPGGECDGADRPPGTDPDRCLVLTPANPELDIRPVKVPVHFDDSGVSVDLINRGGGEFVIVVADT